MDIQTVFNIVISIIAAAGGLSGVSALVVALTGHKKVKSEAIDIASESVSKLLGPLNQRIDDQDLEIKTLKTENVSLKVNVHTLQLENAELRAGVALLSTQVVSLGQNPMYQPKKQG